jgi:hypothetical protein
MLFEPFTWMDKPKSEWPCIYVFLLSKDFHAIVDSMQVNEKQVSLRAQRQECGLLGNSGFLLRNGSARHICLKLRLRPEVGAKTSISERYLFPPVKEDDLLRRILECAASRGFDKFPAYHLV